MSDPLADEFPPITLPPEPALWTFGFLDGVTYQRQPEGWWDPGRGRLREWSDIAADFEPAVPEKAHRKQVIDEVVAFVRYYWISDEDALVARVIEREFGGDDE